MAEKETLTYELPENPRGLSFSGEVRSIKFNPPVFPRKKIRVRVWAHLRYWWGYGWFDFRYWLKYRILKRSR